MSISRRCARLLHAPVALIRAPSSAASRCRAIPTPQDSGIQLPPKQLTRLPSQHLLLLCRAPRIRTLLWIHQERCSFACHCCCEHPGCLPVARPSVPHYVCSWPAGSAVPAQDKETSPLFNNCLKQTSLRAPVAQLTIPSELSECSYAQAHILLYPQVAGGE